MTTTTRTRKSRFLFEWSAADGLDYQGRIVARSGQVGTFTRGGTAGAASAIDANGRVYCPGKSTPRFHHQYNASTGLWDAVGLLLEGARTNLVVQSDALTAANGWTVDAGLTVAADYSRVGSLSLSRITGINGVRTISRAVTLTGDGVKAFSLVVRFGGAGTTLHGLYDISVGPARAAVTVTWASDGTAACVAGTGTLLAFTPLADHTYRILVQTTACTAANNHMYYCVSGGETATAVQMGGLMVEDATAPSSVIPTTTTTITRTADALSFPFNAVLQALTVYADYTTATGGLAQGFFYTISPTGGATPFLAGFELSAMYSRWKPAGTNNDSGLAGSPAIGDRVEALTTLASNGASVFSRSFNGGSIAVGGSPAPEALPASFGATPIITVMAYAAAGGYECYGAIRSLRIAAGVQTMAYMRAA